MPADSFARDTRPSAATLGVGIALAVSLGLSACSHSAMTSSSPSSAAAAQPAAALVGYVWDSRLHGLRPISGSLGAAHLESAVAAPGLHSATPCSTRGFALASDAAGSIFFVALPSGQPTKLAESLAKDQRMVFSPTCANALVSSPSTGSVILLSGLPSSPQVQSLALAGAGIAAAAISDMGAILIATTKSDGSTALQIASASAAPATIASLLKAGGIAFLPGTDIAILADSAANTITLARQLATSPSFTPLAAAAQGVVSPRAVASSADGHFAFVVNGAGNTLLRIDLTSTAAPLPIACNCSPTELLALNGNASFQITDPAAGTIFALNGDAPTPRTQFIPTDSVNAAKGGAQ
jgi:hypothetical protein